MYKIFWLEILKGRDRLEDLGIDGDNIRMDLRDISVNWMHLDQDRDQWRALVNTVMNLRVP
jgi:hypothetical protein